MSLYRGFSTLNKKKKKFNLTDFELAKQDLSNHLHTRKGERVGNPNFGTIIWGLLFEPLTDEVKGAIEEDLTKIINADPRLRTNGLTITEYMHGLQAVIDLTFKETDERSAMLVLFDKGTNSN
jgi:phage baseplate assembly protein W